MGKSRKKNKFYGYTMATSEKKDKQRANRILRRIVKEKLKIGNTNLPKLREISNVWCFSKDGKRYDANIPEKEMRK